MISLKGKKVLLVGGAGFIGHHLALRLQKEGAEVHVIDSLGVNNLLAFVSGAINVQNRELYIRIINQRIEVMKHHGIPLYIQDARDYHVMSKLFDTVKPEVVIQLAAVAHADRSNKDPYSTFDHSLRTLENALDCSRSSGVKHFIYFSSSMVYGNFKNGFVEEDTVCEPLGIYGALKYAGEKMVIAYNQVFNLPYTIVRPSALYGERCVSRRIGQIFIENALQGIEVSINGDGSDRLDFTYIGDLVNGIVKVIENEKSIGQIFNLTYGESRSLADMAKIISEHFPEVKIKYLPKDALMPARGTLSVNKANKIIGYTPQFPLEIGFVNYIKWYKDLFASQPNASAFEIVTLNV